jgi:uncharacterized protein
MEIMSVIRGIYSYIVSIFGNFFVIMVIISFVVTLIERHRLSEKRSSANRIRPVVLINPDTGEVKGERPRVAIIAGASGGLGAKYAQYIDSHPEELGINEIWIIGRDKERLMKVKNRLDMHTIAISMDILKPGCIEGFQKYMMKEFERHPDFEVGCFINCIGAGYTGTSYELGHEKECQTIDLNDKSAIMLTDLIVPFMKPGARIIELCSIASFGPIPNMNAYAASKALLYSYTRALRVELMPRGISVTAVCPYWVYDTYFIKRSIGRSDHPRFASRAENVVKYSIRAAKHDFAVSVPNPVSFASRIFMPLIPDGVLAYIMRTDTLKKNIKKK